MLGLFPRLMLVVGIVMTGAACQDDGYAAPRGYYPAPTGYGTRTTTAATTVPTWSITVWLFAARLYHGDRDEPRSERKS